MKKTLAVFTAAAIAGTMMGTPARRVGGTNNELRAPLARQIIMDKMPVELRHKIRKYAIARKRREEDAIIELLESAV